jgi:hypothetical protein
MRSVTGTQYHLRAVYNPAPNPPQTQSVILHKPPMKPNPKCVD